MEKIINKKLGIIDPYFYPIFRILIGLLFFQFGLQKMFGMFGGLDGAGAVPPFLSLLWWAGIIEFVSGLAVTLGIFTRPLALVAALEMAIAYFIGHFPNGFYPILNGGGPAIMFFASFLVMIRYGADRWSLEKSVLKREIF